MRLRWAKAWNRSLSMCALAAAISSTAAAATATANQSLTASIGAATVILVPGTATLSTTGATFSYAYSATISVSFRVRTSAGGSGAVTLKALSDFMPSGGPSLTSPPAPGDTLSYTCASTYPTACSGSQIVSTSSATPVVSVGPSACTGGGANGCSASDPNSATLSFTLVNDPQYATGTYSVKVLFTTSAL